MKVLSPIIFKKGLDVVANRNNRQIDSIEDTTEVFRPVTQTTPTQDAHSMEVTLMAVVASSNTVESGITQSGFEGRPSSRAE
tara:strand:+ start:172 stop:417 length:246 start_codon:yes stop_codon:yes gene_type:complete